MTESTSAPLSGKLLPELKTIAAGLGIAGAKGMRKADLVDAIRSAQTGSNQSGSNQSGSNQSGSNQSGSGRTRSRRETPVESAPVESARVESTQIERSEAASTTDDVGARLEQLSNETTGRQRRRRGRGQNDEGSSEGQSQNGEAQNGQGQNGQAQNGQAQNASSDDQRSGEQRDRSRSQNDRQQNRDNQNRDGQTRDNQNRDGQNRDNQNRDNQSRNNQNQNQNSYDDDGTGRRGRRRRQRDRQNRRRGGGAVGNLEAEPTISDDDVLVNVGGIVDILDNYACVRTTGYLPGPTDAYLSLAQVRKYHLRKGDVVTGQMRQAQEGGRERFAPMVQVDTVNGAEPEAMRNRPDFQKLTPLYPQERLRLETTPTNMTGRIIDLVSPIGKGQRGLIVSPPKAGKTMIMQNIANSISANNPEVHLMVVLVDERPEEVTDFQRTVSGEVIASTFDRPASDHTVVSELAIERAKRLVELGHDVVVLLDGITRLGRAYNLAAPASGRILSGGVDSAALYPPKKFFGAARNIENGGSLTILATALVDTGSKMDEVIYEEFKGTGNMELHLQRQLANKRIFPAVDVDASSTRREELLLGREELAIMWKLRRVLSGLEDQQALEMLLSRLRKTQNNNEFLVVISKTTPTTES